MKKITLAVSTLLALIQLQVVHGARLAYEGFSYPNDAVGLNGLSGVRGMWTGWVVK